MSLCIVNCEYAGGILEKEISTPFERVCDGLIIPGAVSGKADDGLNNHYQDVKVLHSACPYIFRSPSQQSNKRIYF